MLSLMTLKQGLQFSKLQTIKKEDAIALAVCLGYDYGTANRHGMTVCLYLPDMCHSLFHTTSEHIDWERLETKAFYEVYLALHMTCWALAWKHLNDIKLSNIRWTQNCLRACFQEQIALQHSSIHHRTGVRQGMVDDYGIYCKAAQSTVLVKYSTMEFMKIMVLKDQ